LKICRCLSLSFDDSCLRLSDLLKILSISFIFEDTRTYSIGAGIIDSTFFSFSLLFETGDNASSAKYGLCYLTILGLVFEDLYLFLRSLG